MNKIKTIVLYSESDKAFQKKFNNHLRLIKMQLADVTFIEIEKITEEDINNLLSHETKLVIFMSSAEANNGLDIITNIMPNLEQQYSNKRKRFVVVRLTPCEGNGYFLDKLQGLPNIINGTKHVNSPDDDTIWTSVCIGIREVLNRMLDIV